MGRRPGGPHLCVAAASVSWRACHDGLDLGRSFVERAKFWDGV